MKDACALLVFIGILCGFLGLAGWAAEQFKDALNAAHLDDRERRQ